MYFGSPDLTSSASLSVMATIHNLWNNYYWLQGHSFLAPVSMYALSLEVALHGISLTVQGFKMLHTSVRRESYYFYLQWLKWIKITQCRAEITALMAFAVFTLMLDACHNPTEMQERNECPASPPAHQLGLGKEQWDKSYIIRLKAMQGIPGSETQFFFLSPSTLLNSGSSYNSLKTFQVSHLFSNCPAADAQVHSMWFGQWRENEHSLGKLVANIYMALLPIGLQQTAKRGRKAEASSHSCSWLSLHLPFLLFSSPRLSICKKGFLFIFYSQGDLVVLNEKQDVACLPKYYEPLSGFQ